MPDLGVPGLDQPLPKNWITLEDDFVLIYGVIQVPTRLAWQMRICFTFFGKCPYFFYIFAASAHMFYIFVVYVHMFYIFAANAHTFYIFAANAHMFYIFAAISHIFYIFAANAHIFLHICRGCSFLFLFV